MAVPLTERSPGVEKVYDVIICGEHYLVGASDLGVFYKRRRLLDRFGNLTGWALDHVQVIPVSPHTENGQTTFRSAADTL